MKITFLGTGTSHGIPVIGCSCPVCRSEDYHDKRYRSSLLIEADDTSVVIDTGYEFRLSAIRAGLDRLDAILFTHSHSDHLMGLDDVRVFTKDRRLDIYANSNTIDEIRTKFPYAFKTEGCMKGTPLLNANVVPPYKKFSIGSLEIIPIPVRHYLLPIYGYRIGNFAYLTDVSFIPEESYKALEGVETLVIGALREREHIAHLSFKQAEEVARRLEVSRCFFTHINHETSYNDINRLYGPLCQSAYDNLVLEV